MDQQLLPPKLERPRWQWTVTKWLECTSSVLGIIVFLLPNLDKQIRFAIGVPLASAPISVPIFVWLWKAGRVAYQRVRYYPQLHQCAQRDTDELTKAKRFIYALLQKNVDALAFEITGARYDRGKLYIVLRKRKVPKLVEGSMLVVIDRKDRMPMGRFEVTEVRTSEYYACGISNVDPLWLGYVREKGETSLLPHMAAIYIPEEKGNDE